MSPGPRSEDRHDPTTQTGVSVRLPNPIYDRLEAARAKAGLKRRPAIIAAICKWVESIENGEDPE